MSLIYMSADKAVIYCPAIERHQKRYGHLPGRRRRSRFRRRAGFRFAR
jgi:hypothetical protein